MLKLYSTDWSPWVRKVRISAIERNIEEYIEIITANIGFAEKTLKTVESELTKFNPSGRVPTLITEEGQSVYDSTVIVHYLDSIGKADPIISKNIEKKITSLRINALVDEIIDSLRHLSFENRREKNIRLPHWIEALDKKVRRGIDIIETDFVHLSKPEVNILDLADISTIILLGSIRRNPNSPYNIFSDNLNTWYNDMEERKSVMQTTPPKL
tara:strand:- start:9361 stop:9999 length:639 start_codon:yes stop_codon:yes gene_type:complete